MTGWPDDLIKGSFADDWPYGIFIWELLWTKQGKWEFLSFNCQLWFVRKLLWGCPKWGKDLFRWPEGKTKLTCKNIHPCSDVRHGHTGPRPHPHHPEPAGQHVSRPQGGSEWNQGEVWEGHCKKVLSLGPDLWCMVQLCASSRWGSGKCFDLVLVTTPQSKALRLLTNHVDFTLV